MTCDADAFYTTIFVFLTRFKLRTTVIISVLPVVKFKLRLAPTVSSLTESFLLMRNIASEG